MALISSKEKEKEIYSLVKSVSNQNVFIVDRSTQEIKGKKEFPYALSIKLEKAFRINIFELCI